MDCKDSSGGTPLLAAVRKRSGDVIKLLILKGADATVALANADQELAQIINAALSGRCVVVVV